MKKSFLFMAGLALMAAASFSCTREEVEDMPSELVEMTFKASLNREDTKAELISGNKVRWQEGDEIAIFDGGAIRKFTLVSGAGSATANFYGRASSSASTFYAAAPYTAGKLKSKVLYAYVPEEQNGVENAVDPSALVMTATAARGSTLAFKNAVTLLRFTVPAGVNKVTISTVDGSTIAGEESGTVSVNLPGTAGTFHVAVNPGSYEGISAFMHTSGDVYYKETNNTLTAPRNGIVNLGTLPLTQAIVSIRTASDLKNFLSSTSASDTRKVVIFDDIDMTGVSFSSASDFKGEIDGLGHTISGLSGGNPLFTSLHAPVSNLTLEGSMTTTKATFGALAANSYGNLLNITSRVSVTEALSSAVTSVTMIGSIAGYNYGSMTGCVNEGDIKFTSSSSVTAIGVGGLAGYSSGATSNCVNRGSVAIYATHGTARVTVGYNSNVSGNVGGIAAVCDNGFSATSCENYGTIKFTNAAIENVTANYQRSSVGGIVGLSYGNISDCHNYGEIYTTAKTSDSSALTDYEYIVCTGGIAGSPWGQASPSDKTSIVSCTNDALVKFISYAAKSNSTVGGIVGWPNAESDAITNNIQSCINTGSVIISGKGKVRAGGISGGSGNILSCSNSGKVYLGSANSASVIGGICGFQTTTHKLQNCSNTGEVISNAAIDGVGGILGARGNSESTLGEGCNVNCSVSTTASSNTGVGIVLGRFNGTDKKVTFGTTAKPVTVKGSIAFGGTGYTIHKSNYTSYLAGTTNSASVHTINATCTTAAPATYFVDGYVRYSNGDPAVGVSVSDGFRVAVTDEKGYYTLTARSDTYHIYISYPADAKITKNSDGLPNFYKSYDKSITRYDFTLTKQDVETKFVLFGFGDPQATDNNDGLSRFVNESVPAINNQIAAQSYPCYGVTLGDIVWSYYGTDTNGKMTTMRTNFNKVNMPVFQTMGNHDFTYFSGSSNKLVTDSKSSTIQLKAQRKFEEVFGPINYSFNRGSVHVICMKDIIYDSVTDPDEYHSGFSDAQYAWLQADLANVPTSKMVILCVHIPFISSAVEGDHMQDVVALLTRYQNPQIYSGHTHYMRNVRPVDNSGWGVYERVHAAVCGCWWYSKVNGDGSPNGFSVNVFNGARYENSYYIGVNDSMNSQSYQMRLHRGNGLTGGSYEKFRFGHTSSELMANIFNADRDWTVKVYEDGTYTGNMTFMPWTDANLKPAYVSGSITKADALSTKDWWTIGYHVGVVGRGHASGNRDSYLTGGYHMYKYTLKNPSASSIMVVATDPYGNEYSSTKVFGDYEYPSYIKK
ncbi:MAG: calcineurin-like phosphoesterase family protein [Bacteroidales bacterium]|nr:calcineurin-like phosphoesterase family protein [Bacteroidales bacterium]